jgi:hypothetical protein
MKRNEPRNVSPNEPACIQFTSAIHGAAVVMPITVQRTAAQPAPSNISVVGRSRSGSRRSQKNAAISATMPSAHSQPATSARMPCRSQCTIDNP